MNRVVVAFISILVALISLISLSAGCSNKEKDKGLSESVQETPPIVATVGSGEITVAEFKYYLSLQ